MRTQACFIGLRETIGYPLENLLSVFSPQRRREILRYRQENDRRAKIWAELLTRHVVAKKISRPIEDVSIERDANGKPYIAGSPLQISLSHSRNWVACSVGEVSSGIDVEEDFSDALVVAKNFFASSEYLSLVKLHGDELARKFLSLWTLKESYAKFLGDGISEELLRTDIERFFDGNTVGGRNFFLPEGAVVGICTEKNFLPETFTVVSPKFFRDARES